MQDGSLISDFGMKQVYTRGKKRLSADHNDEEYNNSYVVHVADKRNYLFSLVDESKVSCQEGATAWEGLIKQMFNKFSCNRNRTFNDMQQIPQTAYINVIDIEQGKVIS